MNIFSVTDGTASLILPPYVDFRSDEDKRRYERKLRLLKDPEGGSLQDARDNVNKLLEAQAAAHFHTLSTYGFYGQYGLDTNTQLQHQQQCKAHGIFGGLF